MQVDNLIQKLRTVFSGIPDHRALNCRYPLADNLMSGFSIFHQKDPSLLAFRDQYPVRSHNMKQIYGLDNIPEDTALRKCLDMVQPVLLEPCFRMLLEEARSQELLKQKTVFDGKLAISFDGTGYFSSSEISCTHCLTKEYKNGKATFHHQMLGAVIVSPGQNTVFPVYVEPIVNEDGNTKNDCERNALKRLLPKVHNLLENDSIVAILDALYADGPTIRALRAENMDYLIGIKDGYVLLQVKTLTQQGKMKQLTSSDGKVKQVIRWTESLILNGKNQNILVNYFDCEHIDIKSGIKIYGNTWITNLPINEENIREVVNVARSRWKIENETFNTLKNQGYHLEHNYGHGVKYLSSIFAMLMVLAFFVDQLAQANDQNFIKAMAKFKTRAGFWKRVSSVFDLIPSMSMNAIYKFIAGDLQISIQVLN